MRRSGQPSLPSAITCCRFSSFKTLLTRRRLSPVAVNALTQFRWPVFSCPSLAGFGCPPRRKTSFMFYYLPHLSPLPSQGGIPALSTPDSSPPDRGHFSLGPCLPTE